MNRWLCLPVIVCALAVACEGRSTEQQEVAVPATAPATAPAGVELRATGLWSSSPDLPLSWVASMAVDSRGRVYLWDRDEGILLLDSVGAISRTIARKGEGPGEYRQPGVLQVLPGDSILAYDPRLRRVTVFTPETYAVAYTHRLEGSRDGPGPSWAARVHDPVGYLTMYESSVFSSEGRPRKEEDRQAVLRLLALDGSLRRDSLLLLPVAESIVVRHPSRESLVLMTIPFGRQSVFALTDDDRIVHGWTDSLAVEIRDLDGRRIGGFSAPHEALPLTREEVDEWADRYNEPSGVEDWGHEPGDALREAAPETWPAFERLLLDDHGRIWILLVTREGMPARWVIFEQSGEEVAWVDISLGLQAVRDDVAYGLVSGDFGEPIVSAYRIEGLGEDE